MESPFSDVTLEKKQEKVRVFTGSGTGLQASLQAEADDQGLSLSSFIRSILLQRMRERAKKGS